MNRWLALTVLSSVLGLSGCAHVEPWVKPYQREHLADPLMAWNRHGLANSYILHVHENREATRGGEGAAGGGCGCN
jgi:hypothetical protein